MIRSCVTVSLVEEARGGPFVFWHDLPGACQTAERLGFDAVEVFAPDPAAIDSSELRDLLAQHHLKLAALGTGAGWLKHKLQLTHADPAIRAKAIEFIRAMLDRAGSFGAGVIIGSMQGRWSEAVDHATALAHLANALIMLGEHAGRVGATLLYEPLNRYETNLCNTVGDGVALLKTVGNPHVKLLADLFHMNIEETDLPAAIRTGEGHIGHVHFVDSNRRSAGMGHLALEPIAAALRDTGYRGYLSAEALPYPDPTRAAERTIEAFRKYFQPGQA